MTKDKSKEVKEEKEQDLCEVCRRRPAEKGFGGWCVHCEADVDREIEAKNQYDYD